MHPSKRISILFVIISTFYFGCSDSGTTPKEDNSINIEFPIGKKAVYAIGLYEGDSVDSLKPLGVNIYTLQFDSINTKSDGLEYVGNVELFYFIPDTSFRTGVKLNFAGIIKVSVDDKWVLFQYSDVPSSLNIFMKQKSTLTDTLIHPELYFYQFPAFPKIMRENTIYSAFSPRDDIYINGLQRDFDVKNCVDWKDIYGHNRGLYYTTDQILKCENDIILNIRGIVDKFGVVTSIIDFEDIMLSRRDNPEQIDTLSIYQISRRIVEFTEPENVKDLSWYSNYVLENGLKHLESK